MRFIIFLAFTLLTGLAPLAVTATEAASTAADQRKRCTADGRFCISLDSYVGDVCRTIQQAATQHQIDPHFLARLLWKESLFEAGAISPAGALGIAQFMPGTAEIVGLDDPFNPAKSIDASARYLRQLTLGFGNIGLAAVAYNGGESRAARYKKEGGRLPWETLDYVEAITGHTADVWRESTPEELDLRLEKDREFLPACITLAGNRSIREFQTPQRAWPWGVILASHPNKSGASQQVVRLNRQLRPILAGKRVNYIQRRLSGNPRSVYTAQVGYGSQREAMAFCNRFKSLGGRCMVLRN